MDDTDHWARLAEAIRDRRTALRLSISAAALSGAVNRETWTNAEAAKRQLSRRNWAGVEQALRWVPSSIAKILEGGEPEIMAQAPESGDPALADEIERIRKLRFVTPKDKRRMISALIEVYEEQTAADA